MRKIMAACVFAAALAFTGTAHAQSYGSSLLFETGTPIPGTYSQPVRIAPGSVFGGVPLQTTTVAALPACGAAQKGYLYAVSDATSPTYNGTLTGGGAVSVLAYCNGSAWTAH